MSSRRSRSSRLSGSSSRITDQQVSELVSKLQSILPSGQPPLPNNNNTASTSRVLEEACNYIRSLHKEVDDLSGRLTELLQNADNDTDLEAIIRRLLM